MPLDDLTDAELEEAAVRAAAEWHPETWLTRVLPAYVQARGDELPSEAVAALLGVSKRTVQRIPRETLPYVTTPGGGIRKGHRKYRRDDVERYAREHLGRTIGE